MRHSSCRGLICAMVAQVEDDDFAAMTVESIVISLGGNIVRCDCGDSCFMQLTEEAYRSQEFAVVRRASIHTFHVQHMIHWLL